jgi:hypothetical protein
MCVNILPGLAFIYVDITAGDFSYNYSLDSTGIRGDFEFRHATLTEECII